MGFGTLTASDLKENLPTVRQRVSINGGVVSADVTQKSKAPQGASSFSLPLVLENILPSGSLS